MKKIVLLFAMLCLLSHLFSQIPTLSWVNSAGGTGNEIGKSIEVDATGNAYVIGDFDGTVDFDPGVGVANLTSVGSSDIVISKFDANSNLVWAKSVGGTLADYGSSIGVDVSGNVFVTGYFKGTVDFDPGAGITTISSNGNEDSFVLKLSASGAFIWARTVGGSSNDRGYALTVDPSGNPYITGTFLGTVDFNPTAGIFNLSSSGSQCDLFALKLDAAGNFVWAKRIGGSYSVSGGDIELDASNNLFISGDFNNGIVDFDPGVGVANLSPVNSGYSSCFIVKLDPAGNFVWATAIGGTQHAQAAVLSIDQADNICVTGYFEGTADLDPGAGVSNVSSTGSYDVFIAKYNTNGFFIWGKSFGGTSVDLANAIATDPAGNFYLTGYYTGTVDFDPGSGINSATSTGAQDMYISKFDPSGNFLWGAKMGGVSTDYATSIAIGAPDKVYLTGGYSGTVDFDPNAATVFLTSTGGYDQFLCKLSPCTIPATPTITAGGSLTFCAGGSVVLTSSSASGNLWSTGATTQSITVSTSGTYTVAVTTAGCTSATSAETPVSVNPIPATPTISAGGSTTFCAGGSVVLTSSSASGNVWSTGATTQSITVSASGTYTVDVTTAGCTSATSAETAVSVNPIPATPTISAGGSTTFCAGGSVVLTSSSTSGNVWSTGATTQSITVSTAGTYTVAVTTAGCTSATSAETAVSVNPIPATPTISAGGSTTFCAGGSVVLTSSSASGNVWSTGATTQSITVSTAGTYTVDVTTAGCTSATSGTTTIIVNPNPTVTFGAIPDLCLYSSAITLVEGAPIGGTYGGNGVVGNQFDPSAAGSGISPLTYSYTDGNGCFNVANSTVLVDSCLTIEDNTFVGIHIFPNPSTGFFTIDAENNMIQSVYVYDNAGRFVMTLKGENTTSMAVDMSRIVDGSYTLQVLSDKAIQRMPIVINK